MGDVLSGVTVSLLAQAQKPEISQQEVAILAVYLHSLAGDKAAQEQGEKGMLASDLFNYLREVINAQSAS